jgi:uncharacterized RDD family membrane protein YckC
MWLGLWLGDCTKQRYLAALADNIAAMIVAFFIAANVPGLSPLAQGLSGYGLYLAYFFCLEWFAGATLGKLAFGLRVRSVNGTPCSLWQSLTRTILRILEVNPVLLGALPAFIAILSSKRRQRIGDMLAGTVVVSRQVELPQAG